MNYWPFLDSPNNRIKIHSVQITSPQVYSWIYSKKSCLFQGLGLTNSIFRCSIYCRSILFWSLDFFPWYEHSKIACPSYGIKVGWHLSRGTVAINGTYGSFLVNCRFLCKEGKRNFLLFWRNSFLRQKLGLDIRAYFRWILS